MKYFFWGVSCLVFGSQGICPVGGSREVKTRYFNADSGLPQCIKNLNCSGRDEFNWSWSKTFEGEIKLSLRLSAATVRWNLPYFLSGGSDAVFNLLKTGVATTDSSYRYEWAPYRNIKSFFGDPSLNFRFQKTLRALIKTHYDFDMLTMRRAWTAGLGVIMIVFVDPKDGNVRKQSSIKEDSYRMISAHGQDGIQGSSKFPGNDLKIFFNAQDALEIAKRFNKSSVDGFVAWLMGHYALPSIPKNKLRSALEENGTFFRHGKESLVWHADSLSIFEYIIKSYMISEDQKLFERILDVAHSTSAKTGFLLDFVRYSEGYATIVVEGQYKPNAYHDADYFKKDGMGGQNRVYTCVFGTASQTYLLKWLPDNSDRMNDLFFYMWLTDIWSNGSKLIKHETSDDLSDLYLIIWGLMDYQRIRENSYKNWQHFRSFVVESLHNRTQTSLKFKVFYSAWGHDWFKLNASSKP